MAELYECSDEERDYLRLLRALFYLLRPLHLDALERIKELHSQGLIPDWERDILSYHILFVIRRSQGG